MRPTQTDPTSMRNLDAGRAREGRPLGGSWRGRLSRGRWTGAGALLLALASQAAGGEYDGVVFAEKDVRLAFAVSAPVRGVMVKAGDTVKAGATLVELEDDAGAAQVEVYRARAASAIDADAAEKQWRLAQVEEGLVKEALSKGSAGQFEADRAALKAELARLGFEKAKHDQQESALLLKQAEATHARYRLVSPIDGTVDEVAAQPGETVEQGKPVVRVVWAGEVHVDINPPTGDTLTLKAGQPAWVRLGPLTTSPPVQGVIAHVAAVGDPRSDTRLVRVRVPNHDGLPTGRQVKVSLGAPESAPK